MLRRRWWASVVGLAGVMGPGFSAAQTGAAPTPDAAPPPHMTDQMMTSAIQRHLGALTAESLGWRATPSPGLAATAQYIAAQFAQFGLQTRTDVRSKGRFGMFYCEYDKACTRQFAAGWFQRSPIPLLLDVAQSRVVFAMDTQRVAAGFAAETRVVQDPDFGDWRLPDTAVAPAPVLLVAGRQTREGLQALNRRNLADTILLYVPPPGSPAAPEQDPKFPAFTSRGYRIVVLSAADSATFAAQADRERHQPVLPARPRGRGWTVAVRADSAGRLAALLRAAGVDLTQLRRDTLPVTRAIAGLTLALDLQFGHPVMDTTTVPTVVGIVPGRDPKLKDEYVAILAHMDAALTRDRRDGLPDGLDDNAAGVAGLLALAQAFSQAPPRRSLLFIATGGGTRPEFWGSYAFALGSLEFHLAGLTPIFPIVTVLNLDLMAVPARDSVAVDGMNELQLDFSPAWIAAAHPELNLTVVDGGFILGNRQSDHYPFVAPPVPLAPSLYVHSGRLPNVLPNAGAPTVDADQIQRITRFVYYLSQALADTDQTPRWTDAVRRSFVTSEGP